VWQEFNINLILRVSPASSPTRLGNNKFLWKTSLPGWLTAIQKPFLVANNSRPFGGPYACMGGSAESNALIALFWVTIACDFSCEIVALVDLSIFWESAGHHQQLSSRIISTYANPLYVLLNDVEFSYKPTITLFSINVDYFEYIPFLYFYFNII